MIFNLNKELDRQRFKERCNYLYENRKRVELTQKRDKRTLRQNSYFHLITSWYGLELGYTLDEMKQIIKDEIIPGMFDEYEKNGRTFRRGTSDLNTKEMAIVTDAVRNHASTNGIYLPKPNEAEQLRSLEEQLSRYGNRQYV